MPRIDLPADDVMTEAQKAAVAEAVAGIRGRVPAPMVAWLQSPELASRAQKLGELLRYRTSLESRLSELAILICGRHWTSHHEWTAHKREGLKAGLDPEAIAAIAARRTPVLTDAREQAVYEVSTTLLATGRVPPPLYRQGVTTLGERGMVELVGILGYYCLVALTLNTFELGLPGSVAPELDDPEFATGAA
jgi:4-carboxymuconolactone decarboxylase